MIERERPDALLPTLGGQTALNLAKALHEDGTLERFGVELIGANYDAIAPRRGPRPVPRHDAARPGCGCRAARSPPPSTRPAARSTEHRPAAIVRPAFTLGGRGGGIARTEEEFERIVAPGSPPRRSARC